MFQKDVLNSRGLSELKKRRRRAFLNRMLICAFALLLVTAFFTYISRLPGLNISRIVSEGNSIIDTESIQAVVEDKISGKYLWLFPKTNVLFYPKSAVRRALEAAYPRLRDIEMSVENGRLLLISVAEREPLYTWCGENIDAPEKEQKCYFLDKEGYVFDEAPYFSGDVYFRFYGASGIIPLYPKGSYFARDYFEGFVSLKDSLSVLGLEPRALHLKEDGDAEIYLSGPNTPKVLVRAGADVDILAENLEVALGTEPLKTRFEKERTKLLYLDLRFENKVYSKFNTP